MWVDWHDTCMSQNDRVRVRVWARIWSLGDNLSPLAKILGDICIVVGTDKLIFIQHFFFIHTGKPTKHFFSPDPWYKQEKLSYWCQDFFLSYLNGGWEEHICKRIHTQRLHIILWMCFWQSPFFVLIERRSIVEKNRDGTGSRQIARVTPFLSKRWMFLKSFSKLPACNIYKY